MVLATHYASVANKIVVTEGRNQTHDSDRQSRGSPSHTQVYTHRRSLSPTRMMDEEEHALEIHLELMHALQTRKLRPVQAEEKPVWIGGTKGPRSSPPASCSSPLSRLQAEFLQSSLAMQQRLRPQLERMARIRAQGLHNEQWRGILRELRQRRARSDGSRVGDDVPPSCRLLCQLEEAVNSRPGWAELQAEVREAAGMRRLEPVEYDGFYVIKNLPTQPPLSDGGRSSI